MTRTASAALGAALATLLLGALYLHEVQRTAELRGELRVRSAQLDSAAKALTTRMARVDTVARVDSVTFTRWRTQYVTTTDTIRVRDTLYVRKEVADSTVSACLVALGSCARRVAVRDSLLAVAEDRRALAVRAATLTVREARRGKLTWGLVGAGVGALACTVAH